MNRNPPSAEGSLTAVTHSLIAHQEWLAEFIQLLSYIFTYLADISNNFDHESIVFYREKAACRAC